MVFHCLFAILVVGAFVFGLVVVYHLCDLGPRSDRGQTAVPPRSDEGIIVRSMLYQIGPLNIRSEQEIRSRKSTKRQIVRS